MLQEKKKGTLKAKIYLLGIPEMHSISYKRSTLKGINCLEIYLPCQLYVQGQKSQKSRCYFKAQLRSPKLLRDWDAQFQLKFQPETASRAPLSQHL